MATASYMSGRKKWGRPQALLWSENSGKLDNGLYVPNGLEKGATATTGALVDQFIVLSDHGRSPIDISTERIEKRERTVNGKSRSYHIADKNKFTVSWTGLPSRAFSDAPEFSINGKKTSAGIEFTVDGGAGGVEILDWYENHKGSFWMFLSYDKYNTFGSDSAAKMHLQQYNDVVEVFISNFNYKVGKRGQTLYDFWDITVTLEEA
jgi:hypothetical protein